ncbi:4Fe-4S binding protein [Clostridium tyrobutyricum]|uniref:4Fe-4S binding protein n=1 Tax=Clostridium tyrobutyricum TaxID=1519 RepID=UPI0002E3704D|nr:4Fe-4S binding protein [Clostridium tyrobutyricum]
MAKTSVNICGIEFKNPVIAAAGPPTRDAEMIIKCAQGGVGGIVSKTISTKAAKIPKPCMATFGEKFLNTELWSELTPEHWIEHEYENSRKSGVPIIVGLGYKEDEIANLVPRVDKFADAYEISAHYVGRDIRAVTGPLEAAKAHTDKPVFMKISPGVADVGKFASMLESEGADGIVAINSVGPCLSIDVETGLPRMGSQLGYGWMTGSAIKPIALRHVYEICKAVSIPVFGVGGVSSGKDAIEMIMAGASAVQVCTEAIIHGHDAFGKIAREIDEWLDLHGYNSLDEIRGVTIGKMKKRESALYKTVFPSVIQDKCIGCGNCKTSCMYDAISIADKKAFIDRSKCFGCGLCTTKCKFGAIKL